MLKSWVGVAALLFAVLAGCGGGGGSGPAPSVSPSSLLLDPPAAPSSVAESRPIAAWIAAQSDLGENLAFIGSTGPTTRTLADQTVRQTVRLALGGEGLRLKFSNLYGRAPVQLRRVRVAWAGGPGAIDVTTDTAVTFSSAGSVAIAPGSEVWSDRIALAATAGADLTVSVYVREPAEYTTAERLTLSTQYLNAGDTSSAQAMLTEERHRLSYRPWLAAVDVYRSAPAQVIVTFGDSITEGNGSTPDANRRYPDVLGDRFRQAAAVSISVVNAGLAGNRWLYDRFGLRGIDRFRRDVLGVSGVTHAILLLGINDIGFQEQWTPEEGATAEQITGALTGAIKAGEEAGVKVYLGTILPYRNSLYYSERGERIRQAVNAWIRANTNAAGVIDFEAAVRDPADPLRLHAAWQTGDQLHPNDEGHLRLAQAVPLERFR